MFRVATQNIAQPTVLVLCDRPRCGSLASTVLPDPQPLQDPDQLLGQQLNYLVKQLIEGGWTLSLETHVCPPCAREDLHGKQLVRLADSSMLLKPFRN